MRVFSVFWKLVTESLRVHELVHVLSVYSPVDRARLIEHRAVLVCKTFAPISVMICAAYAVKLSAPFQIPTTLCRSLDLR